MNNIIKRTWNQGSMVNIEDLRGMTFQAESGGHTFVISAVDADGNAVAMSGTPAGTMLRPDNTDQALTCSISGGNVYATLPAGCYDVPGRAGITIFLTSGGQKAAIYAAVVSVTRTQSGTASPGTTASVVDLINAINTAISGIPATDTALKAAMAPTYSNSALYAVGDYAWYNGTLYRCTTAITTAETWTSGHWTTAAIGTDSANELRGLKSALNNTENAISGSKISLYGQYSADYTGNLTSSTSWNTYFIDAEKYFITEFIRGLAVSTIRLSIGFYSSKTTFDSTTLLGSIMTDQAIIDSPVIPAGTKAILLFANSSDTNVDIICGTYNNYVGKDYVDDCFSKIARLSNNVYNPAYEQEHSIYASDGSINTTSADSANCKVNLDYIPIKYGDYISFYGLDVSTLDGVVNYVVYNSSKVSLGRGLATLGGVLQSIEIREPTAAYIRFTVGKNSTNIMIVIDEFKKNYSSLPYIPYQSRILSEALPEGTEDLQGLFASLEYGYKFKDITGKLVYYTNAYITGSGVITAAAANKWECRKILISELPDDFGGLYVKSYTASASRIAVAFYSSASPADANYISGRNYGANGESEIFVPLDVIPANAVSILFPTYIEYGGSLVVKARSENKETMAYTNEDNISTLQKESVRNQRARFDNQFNFIAYSGFVAAGQGMNTEEHYEWACQHKYTAVKGDVRLASDNVIVMCHDAGFTIDENNQITFYNSSDNIPIHNKTSAEWFAMTYTNGYHPCGIDALIRNCKLYGKIAFVTVRSDYLDEIFTALFECLDRYGMRERTIINGFSYETMRYARKYDSSIMLSWVQTKNHKITTQDVDDADALGNCLITCYDYSGNDQTTISNQDPNVLVYAQQKNIRIYEAVIGYDQYLNNDLYDAGVTGAQLECIPSIFDDFS